MSDLAFGFGVPGNGWQLLVGDWNGDGVETAGFYQPGVAAHFYRRTTLDIGISDVDFGFGFNGVKPIVGDWLGPSGTPLLAADGLVSSADEEFATAISRSSLKAIDAAAVDRIDLVTVVEHELGHVAGLKDLDASLDTLMSGTLSVGVRRLAGVS